MTDSKGDPYIEGMFQSINEKNAEIAALKAIRDEAYWLLAWTHQHFLDDDPRDQARGLAALQANRDHLNKGEQDLLNAMLKMSQERTTKP